MDGGGGHGISGTSGSGTPQIPPMPASPPPKLPPQAASPHSDRMGADRLGSDLLTWLRTPRRPEAPGVYAFGHVPRRTERPRLSPDGALLLRAGICLLLCWYAFRYLAQPETQWLWSVIPESWKQGTAITVVRNVNGVVYRIALIAVFGRFGRWPEVYRRYAKPLLARLVDRDRRAADPAPSQEQQPADPGVWPELREAGHSEAADRLDAAVRSGGMRDVDYVRIQRAWEGVRRDPSRLERFIQAVIDHGVAACAHPSGARDLPLRVTQHDLLTHQVRIGAAPDAAKNPDTHRGAGFALDPPVLGTSLLAVGPPGTGKTQLLARRVVESLCLQALAGTAAVVAVGGPEADLGPTEAFDVVIAPGDPDCPYGLDLYGTYDHPDQAAAGLADALLPAEARSSGRTALQQLFGPFHAAHGRYPAIRELRRLLEGSEAAMSDLAAALEAADEDPGYGDELRARTRQQLHPGDPGRLLADRLAQLDRPAFSGFFDAFFDAFLDADGDAGTGSGQARPPFAMRALDHPLRVRIVLPEHTHPEAAQILARVVVGQFIQAACARKDRSLFACLVVDDASSAIDSEVVRGLQRMRSANAGAVLTLRTLADLPEPVRTPLLGAVGCRMAFPGLNSWDGKLFADAWGTVWVAEDAVTRSPDTSGGLLRRLLRWLRGLVTGTPMQTQSVTTRQVERPRWSASELAHSLPSGHAVVSLTTTEGEHVPPVLVNLRG